jgi:superoxide dismutase, Fe-Mn family
MSRSAGQVLSDALMRFSEGFPMQLTRRESFAALAGLAAASLMTPPALAAAGAEAAGAPSGPHVPPGGHAPVALPFDPKRLAGLSENLLVSHHDNNYAGAVKNLNAVELELARITTETPGFLVGGLRERELSFTNSVILHERYFANLGGGGKPAGAVKDAIAAAFGGFPRFEELFRATGLSLAGGSGWTILDLDFSTGDLRIYWAGNHTQSVAFGAPLLVLDMYEHAYQMDYGAAAAKYVDAFFANVAWSEVERRHARASAAWRALQSAM